MEVSIVSLVFPLLWSIDFSISENIQMSFVPPNCLYMSKELTKRWVFINSLKASWNKNSMHIHSNNNFSSNSHSFVHLSEVTDYWEKKGVQIAGLYSKSLYSLMVMPQIKNCVQIINSLKLFGGGNLSK